MRQLNQPSLIRNEEKYVSPETIPLIPRDTPQNNALKICMNTTFMKFNLPKRVCMQRRTILGKTDRRSAWRKRNIGKHRRRWKVRQKCFLLGATTG